MVLDELIVTLAVVAMFVALVSRRVSPAVAVVGALLGIHLLGAVDFDLAFSGFAAPAPVTIAALYVVAAGVERTGALHRVGGALLGDRSLPLASARLSGAALVVSAVLANTPVVAMGMSATDSWCRRRLISASRLLLPLSSAAILGGTLTVIGTSTNLVASDLLAATGAEPLGFFEPARMAWPLVVLGGALVAVAGWRLMPDRGGAAIDDDAPGFQLGLVVEAGGAVDGVTLAAAGLRQLGSVFCVAIERAGVTIAPVSGDLRLRAGDVCVFAGAVEAIADLGELDGVRLADLDAARGLESVGEGTRTAWFEAVVGPNAPVVGQRLRDSGFRDRYQAAVVAIRRSGHDGPLGLGDVRLRAGDSLILLADQGFRQRWKQRRDFVLIRRRSDAPVPDRGRLPLALLALAVVVIAPVLGWLAVPRAALAGAAAMIAFGVLRPREARDAVDLNVVAIVGAASGIGAAVTSSGLADRLASAIESSASSGTLLAAIGLVVVTLVATEVVTNVAAVALMAPVALAVAGDLGADPRRFLVGVTIAASTSFLTPIGYQTNTMVLGPGRYRPADYLRLGLPLTSLVVLVIPAMMVGG